MSMVTASSPPHALPTIVHVSLYPFDPSTYPAIWRTILGLSRHFLNVVVCGNNPGYFHRPSAEAARLAAEAGIEVLPRQDIYGLARPDVAAAVAASITRRYGRIGAVVGHLQGSVGAFHLARQVSAPILAFFHGDDANIHLQGKRHSAVYASLRDTPDAFFLGVSQSLVDRLIAFGMPPERTFVQHLGIDLCSYPAPREPDIARPAKIVMVGAFRPQKGHEIAIKAFAQFARRFPGAASYRRDLKA